MVLELQLELQAANGCEKFALQKNQEEHFAFPKSEM